ncbi:MAG: DUF6242 domain-containing protein [Candidatus Amulumruptor caecigallinarius]|nr:DUF6242 domain-containing protein [Candidatus Amulumruptor caecigallinarius]
MKIRKFPPIAYVAIAMTFGIGMTSCNEDSESVEYTNPVSLAVSEFKLKYDSKNPGVDSVFFSIDEKHGVIYNADSLRTGTKINKLVPVISYGAGIDKAVISMTGGSTRTGDVNYLTNPSDSIDFTGNVTLTLGTGTQEMTYRIKVNVHKQVPDSLKWDLDTYSLPSRLPSPKAQKTVELGGKAMALILESDNSYTVATSSNLIDNEWTRTAVSFSFTPDIKTICASENALWMLDINGNLLTSDDMRTWRVTGKKWDALIGGYNSTAIGLTSGSNGKLQFAQYPTGSLAVGDIPEDFPVTGFSNFVTLKNKWTSTPVAFFAGGVTVTGSMSQATWAFDGSEWVKLSEGGIPQVSGATIIQYYNYRRSASGESMSEYPVWLLIGGEKADGTFNRDVYLTYDNGVNWTRGTRAMQLPATIPAMANCDNIVMGTQQQGNISDSWKSGMLRIPYEVEGDVITWECPYIYLIGGYDANGTLYNTIYRGVLTRLTFTPII